MRTLLLAIALSFVITGCGSKDFLDGTTWKGKGWTGTVTYHFDNGIILESGEPRGEYECLEKGRVKISNGHMNFYGEIKNDVLKLEGKSYKKQ